MGELDGRAALVTGGTTGLGFAVAGAFLREGARVAFTGRDDELGRRAEAALSTMGYARFLRADAADASQVGASVETAVGSLGGLDVLVNNAGVGVQASPLATTLEDFDRVLAVNLRGAFCYAQACFPHLEARGGCMIHIGSDAGEIGEVEIGVYSVSKAAVHMLAKMLAVEGGRRGVRSNVIAPGDTEPGMRHMGALGAPRSEDDPATWLVPPVGRHGQADDVAAAAVYLAGVRASFVNGAVLLVDGGARAGFHASVAPRH